MKYKAIILTQLALGLCLAGDTLANEFELRGNLEFQYRHFFEKPLFATQPDSTLSAAFAPELFWRWNDGQDSLEFIPSARIDQHDDERTHADIRELAWIHVGDQWESRIGIRRIFWGVTEFQHLVDVVNQSDSVEDVDNEDKLGQPMVNLSLVKDWGIVDLFVLPYFRERTFAGEEGRPGLPFINADGALYQDDDQQQHVDYALRWAKSLDNFELGLSVFDGTSREPLLIPDPNVVVVPELPMPLLPYYYQITQLGFDLQAVGGDTLWKLEFIRNQNDMDDYSALQAGFEHSIYGVLATAVDLGLLMEYGWNDREDQFAGLNQNDLFLGARLGFNDADSSELLAGVSYDLDHQSRSLLIEGSTRLSNSFKASIDVRLFSADEMADPIYLFRQDDHVQLTLQYFY